MCHVLGVGNNLFIVACRSPPLTTHGPEPLTLGCGRACPPSRSASCPPNYEWLFLQAAAVMPGMPGTEETRCEQNAQKRGSIASASGPTCPWDGGTLHDDFLRGASNEDCGSFESISLREPPPPLNIKLGWQTTLDVK